MVQNINTLRTTYPQLAALLDQLLAKMEAVLGSKRVGVYLYGSLVVGDFDSEISDIDLLAAIASDLDEIEFAALEQMHGEIVASYPQWNDRIEIAYLSVEGLQTFKTRRSPIAVISPGEPFNLKDAGADWLMNWYHVREKSVTLFGAPPQEVIAPISKAEFLQCIRQHAIAWRGRMDDTMSRPYQSYSILTLSRALYTLTHGEHVSKRQAVEWAAQQMPEWASTIHDAWVWRSAVHEAADPAATLDNTRHFVNTVIDKILEQPSL
ncbi:MAG: aminoglycoside adenylyltransferase domain-containing protein [Chloroflexota bacterium]